MPSSSQQLATRAVAEIAIYEPIGAASGSASEAFDAVQTVNDADAAVIPSLTKNITVGLEGLTADHTLTMPIPAMTFIGQRWTFVDLDGSLSSGFTWTIDGNGSTINGLSDFALAMSAILASPGGSIGPRGSISIRLVAANTFVLVE